MPTVGKEIRSEAQAPDDESDRYYETKGAGGLALWKRGEDLFKYMVLAKEPPLPGRKRNPTVSNLVCHLSGLPFVVDSPVLNQI